MDFYVSMAIAVLIQVARNGEDKSKWRRALLKVFREIARAFPDDDEFLEVAAIQVAAARDGTSQADGVR